jgi:penicillin-binding protein 1A
LSHAARIRRRRRGPGPSRYVLLGVLVVLVLGLVAGGLALGWVYKTAASAPPLSSLKQRNPGSLTEVFASDGTRLGFIQADDLVQPVNSKRIPDVMRQATVAIEDERFYKHKGVDYEGIIRAAVKNFTEHETVQGASTLTMQLVRNLYTEDRARDGIAGYKRKIREAELARELEEAHPKSWVLTKYLNTVPYGTVGGQTAIGVGAASRLYFNKRPEDLNLRQAAMLAGMPQAPSRYSPVLAPGKTKQRRNEVLRKMAELKMVTPQQAQSAMSKGLDLHMEGYFKRARERYVLDYIQSELIKEYGVATVKLGGLRVYTTIDLDKQHQAREAIKEKMGDIGPSSAIVSIDPRNGDILAMASSAQYGKSKFNLAAQGHRQPGSSFKVMALMTALRLGVNPNTTSYVSVSPMTFNDPPCAPWTVKTYGGTSGGTESLVRATLASDNVVYAQLTSDLGPDKVKETARMLGITSKLNGYCAESLGGLENGVSPLEMADAYATIASGGYRNRPRIIRKVNFPDGHSELPKAWRVKRTKVFSDGVTYEATKILEANVAGGTGTHAQIGCPQGGKTGTTDRNTDAWFVGFTPRMSTAVWVGYPNSRIEMNGLYFGRNVDGGTYPADIWAAYMKQAVGKFCGDFAPPKEPFVSQPFLGHYATTGRPKAPEDDQSAQPGAEPTATPTPGADDTGATNGGDGQPGFDPNKYETPPQATPQTDTGGTTAPPPAATATP